MQTKIEVQIYRSKTGKVVFLEWLKKLDKTSKAIIDTRITRVRGGNFGDCKRLIGADGVHELRIDFGPGFRVYYGKDGDTIVILLCGGDKKHRIETSKKPKSE